MASLEIVMAVFFAACCLIFSAYYAFMDYHHGPEIRSAVLTNFRDYFLGLIACGIIVMIIQSL